MLTGVPAKAELLGGPLRRFVDAVRKVSVRDGHVTAGDPPAGFREGLGDALRNVSYVSLLLEHVEDWIDDVKTGDRAAHHQDFDSVKGIYITIDKGNGEFQSVSFRGREKIEERFLDTRSLGSFLRYILAHHRDDEQVAERVCASCAGFPPTHPPGTPAGEKSN